MPNESILLFYDAGAINASEADDHSLSLLYFALQFTCYFESAVQLVASLEIDMPNSIYMRI